MDLAEKGLEEPTEGGVVLLTFRMPSASQIYFPAIITMVEYGKIKDKDKRKHSPDTKRRFTKDIR